MDEDVPVHDIGEAAEEVHAKERDPFLDPNGDVVVIGASLKGTGQGYNILRNMCTSPAKLRVVNDRVPEGQTGQVCDKPAFHSLRELVESNGVTPKLAVISTPAPSVAGILAECGRMGIERVIIISAGFSETGTEEGKRMEAELKEEKAKYPNMKVVGPNCLGVKNVVDGFNPSFSSLPEEGGTIGFISQSGALAVLYEDAEEGGQADPAASEGKLKFSATISIGNASLGMGTAECIDLLAEDEHTNVIGIYAEQITDGKKFVEAIRGAKRKGKKVVLLMASSAGAKKAASSHTAAASGGKNAFIDIICKREGVYRADSSADFSNALAALSAPSFALTDNAAVHDAAPGENMKIAFVTNAGGPGVLSIDELCKMAENGGLPVELAKYSPECQAALEQKLHQELRMPGGINNPLDVIGDARLNRFKAALDILGIQRNIHALIMLVTEQNGTPVDEFADAIIAHRAAHPESYIVPAFMGKKTNVSAAVKTLREAGFYNAPTGEEAVRAAVANLICSRRIEDQNGPAERAPEEEARVAKAYAIVEHFCAEHEDAVMLPARIVEELMDLYELPRPRQYMVTQPELLDAAVDKLFAETAEKPNVQRRFVAKVEGDIAHKLDVGGLEFNIETPQRAREAYERITHNMEVRDLTRCVRGVLFQEQYPSENVQQEFLFGGERDEAWGPAYVFGHGGSDADRFNKHMAVDLLPLGEMPSEGELMADLAKRSPMWKFTESFRGQPGLDQHAIAGVMRRLMQMMEDLPQIAGFDCNPIAAFEKGKEYDEKSVLLPDLKIRLVTRPVTPRA